jgi:dienelactone hydrolase
MVVPASWQPLIRAPKKTLVWLLGRGNTRTELAFLNERMAKPPEVNAAEGFTVIPYGRFCNATKFAGEVDVFEALAHARASYDIDPARTAVAGFSMGGASAWHLGAHFAGMWSFVSPGAGFAETREYAKVFAPGKVPPPPWEQTLWRWYDATEYAANLGNVPTLAYSGEIDKQIQSAEIMKRFAQKEGVTIEHFIGPKTEHKYEPETRKKLVARMEEIWAKPNDAFPSKLRVVTNTLIYPRQKWLTITGMEKQWERAEITAEMESGNIALTTKNVSALALEFGTGSGAPAARQVTIDGQKVEQIASRPKLEFAKNGAVWVAAGPEADPAKSRGGVTEGIGVRSLPKKPGLCGPIDHAFMSSFLHVRPTGEAQHEKVGAWAMGELEHARNYWRQIFRGDAPVKDDIAITDDDIRNSNLVLWGDPSSNAVLKRVVGKLPLEWTKEKLVFGAQAYDPSKTVPVLIFPNPLNPEKYVVLNSGVTFRESAMGTNSQQTPKLPDWAIVNLDTPPGPDWPGEILRAGFFDEYWKFTATQPSQPK